MTLHPERVFCFSSCQVMYHMVERDQFLEENILYIRNNELISNRVTYWKVYAPLLIAHVICRLIIITDFTANRLA